MSNVYKCEKNEARLSFENSTVSVWVKGEKHKCTITLDKNDVLNALKKFDLI